MIIVPNLDQFNISFIYLYTPVKNNIIENSKFIRIIYSEPRMTLNGLYLVFDFKGDIQIEKYFNKFKFYFKPELNEPILNDLINIEKKILDKLNITNKSPSFQIADQLKMGFIKLFSKCNNLNSRFIIKVSGIWESDKDYGLTFKFTMIENS